jgi:AraC-like DNA-binding protein
LAALLHFAPMAHAGVAPRAVSAMVRRSATPALLRSRDRLADGAVPPSLADMARDAGLGRYQFLRAFSCAFGLPPHAWAQQQRLARAEAWLARGAPLAEAAAATGFADQSHMTRAFRRFRGYTPGRYAAAMRAGLAAG